MTLLTVSTVKGAPGGSTVALLLARVVAATLVGDGTCVLAECDLSGGDLAPRLGLPAIPGVASLALAARHGLTVEVLLAHTQASDCSPRLRVLPGVAGPEQGMALSWIMGDLGQALADPSIVAVADLGRLRGDVDDNDRLRRIATANLLVTKDDVASLLHSRAAVETARHAGTIFGIVLTGERTRRVSQVSGAIGAEVVGEVRFDPKALSLVLHPRRPTTRTWKALRCARGLISDAEAIVSRLSGPDCPLEQDFRTSALAGGGTDSPARSGVTGRARQRAVLVG